MNQYEVFVEYDGKHVIYRTHVRAISSKSAGLQVKQDLISDGWEFVNEDALVLEVERVYATRYDCNIELERVQQAA